MIEAAQDLHTGLTHVLRPEPLTAEVFKPFGALIVPPAEIGDRSLYTKWLGSGHTAMTPRLHVNRVAMSTLPLEIGSLEQHPFSAQVFIPIDVSRFVVIVAPANELGGPDLARAQAFVAPGNVGIVYAAGVWHAGATVLDRDSSFAVLMWRNDTEDDERFCQLDAPLKLQL